MTAESVVCAADLEKHKDLLEQRIANVSVQIQELNQTIPGTQPGAAKERAIAQKNALEGENTRNKATLKSLNFKIKLCADQILIRVFQERYPAIFRTVLKMAREEYELTSDELFYIHVPDIIRRHWLPINLTENEKTDKKFRPNTSKRSVVV